MQVYVTPNFLIGCAIWIAFIAFIIGFFVGACMFSNKK